MKERMRLKAQRDVLIMDCLLDAGHLMHNTMMHVDSEHTVAAVESSLQVLSLQWQCACLKDNVIRHGCHSFLTTKPPATTLLTMCEVHCPCSMACLCLWGSPPPVDLVCQAFIREMFPIACVDVCTTCSHTCAQGERGELMARTNQVSVRLYMAGSCWGMPW